jgi:hypothetical protein
MILSICINSLLYSNLWEIKQDDTGNFQTIQEGIVAAANNDTILVYPGTYYENIDYLSKSLTITSLYLFTPQDSLINQTIIDGNQQGRCVTIQNSENATIIGFTIRNGKTMNHVLGSGGGVLIKYVSNCVIEKCKIINNKAAGGGGICIFAISSSNSNVLLKGNTIANNYASLTGGGINAVGNSLTLSFSGAELNNVYLNYSPTASDISFYTLSPIDVIVDTFTVANPDYFYLIQPEENTFSCQHAKMQEIDQDLFVSPNGNDNNSGLTPEDPLQTIAWAQRLIKRNDDNPHTIHLANGIYSPSLNNQIFPLNVKYGVKYIGESKEGTILDGDNETFFFNEWSRDQNEFAKLVMKNITMKNGFDDSDGAGCMLIYQSDINLENVIIEDCNGSFVGTIFSYNGYCNLKNVIIRNTTGGYPLCLAIDYNCPNPVRNVSMVNTKIQHSYPKINEQDFPGGGGLLISGHVNIQGDYYGKFINCEFSHNHNADYDPQTGLGGTSVMLLKKNVVVDIANCTFGDNTLSYNTGSLIRISDSKLKIFNSIIWDNSGYSFIIWGNPAVSISHSLLEGGNANVYPDSQSVNLNWLEGNLTSNPQWDSNGENPYGLTNNSPCIDAGTLDLPEGVELPEFDLAGNPRIYGDTVDMGAYEWQGTDGNTNDTAPPIERSHIINYPNPFSLDGSRNGSGTNVKLYLQHDGEVEIGIYNIRGQKVKSLMKGYCAEGEHQEFWNGTNDNNKRVSSGNYLIKLSVDGEVQAVRKCLLMK